MTYSLVNCGCSIYFFLYSANLICLCTDILKYFRKSLGLRDNKSRMYIFTVFLDLFLKTMSQIIQSNFNGSNFFGTIENCSRYG